MKNMIVIIVFVLLGGNVPAQHTWYWGNPYPDGNHLNDIWFTSADHGWAVGNGGKLLHYDGQRWTGYEHLTFQNLNGIWFTDENHGWAVGNNGVILKYTNGTWTIDVSGNTKNLRDVCFTGVNNGWAVGDVRMHYNGTQWTTLDTIGYGGLTEVFFTDASNGWCGGFDKFYKYDSTGWHWFPLVSSDIIAVNSLYFTDQQHGWIGGYYSDGSDYIMKYNGSAWNWMNTHPQLSSNALYFENPAHGWSCGGQTTWNLTDTTVYEFTGTGWVGSYASKGVPYALAPAGAGELYMATQYGHILRKDAAGWGYSNTLAEGSIELSFPDTVQGWAVGDGKNILQYRNGNWKADTSFSGVALQHIHFADSLNGIAGGWSVGTQRSSIYRYSGNGWHLITDTLVSQIKAVCALPGGESWIAGQTALGVVRVHHLAGNTLSMNVLPGLSAIGSLSFPDATQGWAIGTQTGSVISKIIRYQNGSWVEELTAPSNQTLAAVSFSSPNSGWVVGKTTTNAGITYHFDGQSWAAGPGTSGGLRAVHHPDPAHVYAVSASGVYTLTNNVWNPEPLGTGQNLTTISFPSPQTGWVGGEYGGILSTRSSFPVTIPEQGETPQIERLLVFPNPANDKVTIEIPTNLVEKNGQPGFGSKTGNPQGNTTTLEVYDLSGRKLYEKEILHGQNTLEINVSQWPRGMYNFILRFNMQTVASEKVVVR
ncbi:MAG: T9SS type A sorting domain-containing protein [bacterium]